LQGNVNQTNIIDTLKVNYMPYSMSVIVSRALPEIDGFKPSHRKLLYTMFKMGLIKGAKTKSANIVGQTMRLNPHGDGAIYETMVRLTRGNEALLHPFVDSKGNFGKRYSRDMSYAAHRYTEAKLEKLTEEFFNDIHKNTVDFIANYDNTTTEPRLLPTSYPNILTTPNLGIAVGMASNIPSFNLKEICKTTIEYLKDETVAIEEHLLAPDFPSGGEIVYSKEAMRQIYNKGRGSFKIRGKYRYDEKNNCIDIFQIPYTTTVEAIMEKLIDYIKSGKIKEISDLRDETDKNGLKITLDLKRGVDQEKLMTKIFRLTALEDSFSCNFNVLIDSSPRVLGVREILREWTSFRMDCIRRKLQYDITDKTKELHLLKGLEKILLDIDKAVKIVKDTKVDREVVPNLMEGFTIDQVQADFIAEIKLRNFNQEYILKKTKDIKRLEKEIQSLETTLNSEKKIKNLISKDLQRVMEKYGQERRTTLIHEEKVQEFKEEIFISEYNVKFFITKDQYFKKIPLTSLRVSNDHKLKDYDEVMQEVDGSNKEDLLFFSNKHQVYKLKAYELEDAKASVLGDFLPNLLELDEGEEIIYMTSTLDYSGWMLFFYKTGKAARIPLSSYETKTNRKKLAKAYNEEFPLVHMEFIKEDKDFVAISSIQKVLVFNTKKIKEKNTRHSRGIQVLKPKKESYLKEIKQLEDVDFEDMDYYRGSIATIGTYLKKTDHKDLGEQLQLL